MINDLRWVSSDCDAGYCVQVAAWRKGSRSSDTANCVEAAPGRCESASCVEATGEADRVLVRDTKLAPTSPVLTYTPLEWLDILDAIKSGELPHCVDHVEEAGEYRWTGSDHAGVKHALIFNPGEWDAFETGVNGGEFDDLP